MRIESEGRFTVKAIISLEVILETKIKETKPKLTLYEQGVKELYRQKILQQN